MGAAIQGVYQGRCGCPDLRENLRGVGSGRHAGLVRDVGYDNTHWEGSGRIILQGGPQDEGMINLDRAVQWMGISPAGRISDGGVITGGGDLHLPPP